VTDVQLVLISHTNVGKTSLARTLLREDVGEVVDATHTTLENRRHVLETAGDDVLVLWDTPGFGDTARLKQRLEQSDRPLPALLAASWDRVTDRPLWCAQQAMVAVRDEADLVLYLVNASEDPEFATYIDLELSVLAWLDVPVLVLLNQLPPDPRGRDRARLVEAWRAALDRPPVRDVLALDAFQRIWIEEGRLLERIRDELPDAPAAALHRLLEHWRQRQRERFLDAVSALRDALADTVADREALGRGQPARLARLGALRRLGERLAARTRALDVHLVTLEAIEGETLRAVETDLTATRAHGERPSPGTGAAGGAMVGAGAGAALDLLFAGLTFGIAWRWCWQAVDARTLGWSAAFVGDLAAEYASRWLAITHHGRARGAFEESALGSWRAAVAEVRGTQRGAEARLTAALDQPRLEAADVGRDAAALVHGLVTGVLLDAYPDADWLLDLGRAADP
jgi:hypothetical protein